MPLPLKSEPPLRHPFPPSLEPVRLRLRRDSTRMQACLRSRHRAQLQRRGIHPWPKPAQPELEEFRSPNYIFHPAGIYYKVDFRYNPFRSEIQDITAPDLSALREVAEGWYVEYKSQSISVRAFGKSLSAFANQYGGWLIVGVVADSLNLTASAFPGVQKAEVPSVLESLRNAAKDVVNPEVYYQHRVFEGPIDDIALPTDRSVIVVRVPQGVNTPYVHLDGRIYRRVADSSDPRPETDRSLLDRLWSRGDRARQRLASLVTRKPTTSKGESENTYLHLTIVSDPYGIKGHWFSESFAEFVALMKTNPLPFDNFYSQAGGFIARQTNDNDQRLRLFTWEFSRECASFVTIPINTYSESFRFAEYSHGSRFWQQVERHELRGVRFLDLNVLFGALGGVATRHRVLAQKAGVSGPFFVKAHLENIWRTVPFIDMSVFTEHIDECGIPIVQADDVLIPPGTDPVTFTILEESPVIPPPTDVFLKDAISLSIPIFQALGVPGELFVESRGELVMIGERFREIQAARSKPNND